MASAQLTPRIIAIVFRNPVVNFCLTLFVFTFTFSSAVLIRIDTSVPQLTSRLAACAPDGWLYGQHGIQGGSHQLVHLLRLRAFDEIRGVSVPAEERLQFLVRDARQDGRVGEDEVQANRLQVGACLPIAQLCEVGWTIDKTIQVDDGPVLDIVTDIAAACHAD